MAEQRHNRQIEHLDSTEVEKSPYVFSEEKDAPGRTRILEAARQLFPQHGYRGTTLREIAQRAGVDVALIAHHFGDKQGLYDEATKLAITLGDLAHELSDVDTKNLGCHLVRVFAVMWTSREATFLAAKFKTLLIDNPDYLRDVLYKAVWVDVRDRLVEEGIDHVDMRVVLAASQIVGLGMSRVVFCDPTLGELDLDTFVAVYGPFLQQTLTGNLFCLQALPDDDAAAHGDGSPH